MKTIVRCGLFSLHDDNLIKSIDYKMAKSKGSDSIQIVNLSNLPKTKNSKYDWKNSVGCCIPYYSKNDCGTLQISDVEKIEKRMTAVFGTSIAGATIGAVGTGTSIVANTDKIRNDNSDAGKQTEKTLNTISNVAAGTNIATGIVGTGLNISLITLTRDLMRTAQNCEDTL